MKIRWDIIGTICFVKICIFVLIFVAYAFFPFNTSYYLPNFIYPKGETISLKTAYKTWDAQHYLYVSENGYHPGNDSNAFAPLYPFLIHILNVFIQNSFLSGLLISNVSSVIGSYLFFILVRDWFNEKVAYKSLIFLLCFPTSFFFSLIYSESIFFLLLILFFLLLSKKHIALAALIALLIPTARVLGIFIFLPFLTWYIFEYQKLGFYDEVKEIMKRLLKKEALYLMSPLLGIGLVMVFLFFATGNAFAQFDAQKQFISHYSIVSYLNPFSFLSSFFQFPLALHGFTNSILDRLFFVMIIVMIILMTKKLSVTLIVFSIAFGVLPVMGGSFMSYMRYTVVIFPLFILLALLVQNKKYKFLEFPIIFIFLLLQTLFVIMHCLNYWVA